MEKSDIEFKGKMAWGRNERFGMGLVRSSSFGRKRVALISSDVMEIDCFDNFPAKKLCYSYFNSEMSALERLPQDVLIRILCGVEHDDLKSLFFVSKSIREATLIAKQWYFAYSTPKKTMIRFPNAIDMENLVEFNEIEQAPKQARLPRARLSHKKLADISVALFTSGGEENWRSVQ